MKGLEGGFRLMFSFKGKYFFLAPGFRRNRRLIVEVFFLGIFFFVRESEESLVLFLFLLFFCYFLYGKGKSFGTQPSVCLYFLLAACYNHLLQFIFVY